MSQHGEARNGSDAAQRAIKRRNNLRGMRSARAQSHRKTSRSGARGDVARRHASARSHSAYRGMAA